MKDKRPIEEQVAELTEVQRKNLGKIFTGHMIVVVVLVLALLITVGVSFYNVKRAEELWEEAIYRLNNSNYILSDEYDALFDASLEAMDRYFDFREALSLVMIAGGGVIIVLVIAMAVFVKVKFPYYSEKKYFYVRKMSKGR